MKVWKKNFSMIFICLSIHRINYISNITYLWIFQQLHEYTFTTSTSLFTRIFVPLLLFARRFIYFSLRLHTILQPTKFYIQARKKQNPFHEKKHVCFSKRGNWLHFLWCKHFFTGLFFLNKHSNRQLFVHVRSEFSSKFLFSQPVDIQNWIFKKMFNNSLFKD